MPLKQKMFLEQVRISANGIVAAYSKINVTVKITHVLHKYVVI